MAKVDLNKKKGKGKEPVKATTAVAKQPPAPKPQPNVTQRQIAGPASSIEDLLNQDAGSGLEKVTAADLAIPRITIIQGISPQVTKGNAAFIEGAEVGMIYDPVSGALYDGTEGVLMVFVSFRHTILHWWPRNSSKGKGFIADLGNTPEANATLAKTTKTDKGEQLLPDGSEIVPTNEYFAFLITDEQNGLYDRVLVPMAKGQMQSSRKLNTLATSLVINVNGTPRQAPFFFRAYRVKTAPKTNKNNQTYMVWDVEPADALLPNSNGIDVLPYGEKLYLEARTFKADAEAGKVQVKPPVETDLGGGDPQGGNTAGGEDAPM